VGALGEMAVFERQNDSMSLRARAMALASDLHFGRWAIVPATYRYVMQEVARRAPEASRDPPQAVALTEAVERLWEEWRTGAASSAGRASLEISAGSVLAVWRSSGSAFAAFVGGPGFVEQQWMASMPSGLALSNPPERSSQRNWASVPSVWAGP
jgi:hypothetical protein